MREAGWPTTTRTEFFGIFRDKATQTKVLPTQTLSRTGEDQTEQKMSSVNTAWAPSYGAPARKGAGGSGKRGRDDDDDHWRRPHHDRPKDKISAADFGPEGAMRRLILLLLQTANLGKLPHGSITTTSKTYGTRLKPEDQCAVPVRRWLNGVMNTRTASLLAEAFRDACQAANDAGFYDQVVTMLTRELRERAQRRIDTAEDEDDDDNEE